VINDRIKQKLLGQYNYQIEPMQYKNTL
jgi:hypothetical protein